MHPPPIRPILIIVSDTSPILNLARVGRLELLTLLYKQVFVPPTVLAELTAVGSDVFATIDIALNSWLVVRAPKNQERIQDLRGNLDSGEAEAIVLALECQAERLLVDERRGRRTARHLGCGSLGYSAS